MLRQNVPCLICTALILIRMRDMCFNMKLELTHKKSRLNEKDRQKVVCCTTFHTAPWTRGIQFYNIFNIVLVLCL